MAKMIIGGQALDSSDGAVLEVLNPATGKLIDTVPAATQADIAKAVAQAVQAQKIWAQYPIHQRGDILNKFVALALTNKEDLAQTLSQETGKPIREARNEIDNIPLLFGGFVEKAKHLYGLSIPNGSEKGQEKTIQITVREPIGVVACIIPFNFPCDLFDQKVAASLITGNAAIVKPSTDNPLTLIKLTQLLVEAGVPAGAVQIVTGRGSKVGSWLCSNPAVHGITFTGSTGVGIETALAGAKNLAHVALELGGNDAFIVCQDADVDLAVQEMLWGRMYNTGQVCCASKRFIVHNSRKAEFAAKSVAAIRQMKWGDPAAEDTQIGCLISEKAAIEVEKQVNLTLAQGGNLLLGGSRKGAFYAPTVIDNVPKTADVAKDMEIFGPVVPIIGFDTLEEAIEIANHSSFGLCSAVFTKDMATAFKVCYAMEAGGAVINGASFFRSCEMPFGGYKDSGLGTEGIASSLDAMTKTKTIVLKNILA